MNTENEKIFSDFSKKLEKMNNEGKTEIIKIFEELHKTLRLPNTHFWILNFLKEQYPDFLRYASWFSGLTHEQQSTILRRLKASTSYS